MDFSTLVDLWDFFDEATTDAISDAVFSEAASLTDVIPEAVTSEIPQIQELPEYKPLIEEYKPPEEIPQEQVQQLRQEADTRLREGGQSGFMDWWGNLPDKQKETLFRATMSSVGMGAQGALQSIQQRRSQEFQREMQEREYQERDKERRAAEEARRVAGTPSAYQFNVSRGLIGQNMGGG